MLINVFKSFLAKTTAQQESWCNKKIMNILLTVYDLHCFKSFVLLVSFKGQALQKILFHMMTTSETCFLQPKLLVLPRQQLEVTTHFLAVPHSSMTGKLTSGCDLVSFFIVLIVLDSFHVIFLFSCLKAHLNECNALQNTKPLRVTRNVLEHCKESLTRAVVFPNILF